MLVTFTTEVYADITMFGDVAIGLLKMMEHNGTVPGAIVAEDVPAALRHLTAALDAEQTPTPATGKDADPDFVSTAHRAIPLVDLLTAAAEAHVDVMWT